MTWTLGVTPMPEEEEVEVEILHLPKGTKVERLSEEQMERHYDQELYDLLVKRAKERGQEPPPMPKSLQNSPATSENGSLTKAGAPSKSTESEAAPKPTA